MKISAYTMAPIIGTGSRCYSCKTKLGILCKKEIMLEKFFSKKCIGRNAHVREADLDTTRGLRHLPLPADVRGYELRLCFGKWMSTLAAGSEDIAYELQNL
jgi:hypothetical protein